MIGNFIINNNGYIIIIDGICKTIEIMWTLILPSDHWMESEEDG